MRIGLVTSYMPPHLGGIERIGENLFQGYTRHGVEVRWLWSFAAGCRTRMAPASGCRASTWSRTCSASRCQYGDLVGGARLDRLCRWADALHVLECLYTTSGLAVCARRNGMESPQCSPRTSGSSNTASLC